MNKYEIVFISNFSTNLDNFLFDISKEFSDLDFIILTYRKSHLKNTYSYEEFLEKNYKKILQTSNEEVDKNFSLSPYLGLVSERFIANYYFGIENTLGNKTLKDDEYDFFVKSLILFLEPFIKETKFIFGGHADNIISFFRYFLSSYYKKNIFLLVI